MLMISSNHAGSALVPAMSSGSVMFSRAVREGIRLKDWKTKPSVSRRTWVTWSSLYEVMTVPAIVDSPAVSRSRPARV